MPRQMQLALPDLCDSTERAAEELAALGEGAIEDWCTLEGVDFASLEEYASSHVARGVRLLAESGSEACGYLWMLGWLNGWISRRDFGRVGS